MYLPAYLTYLGNIVVAITCSYSTAGCLFHVLPVCILDCLVAENDPHPVNPYCWCPILDNKINLVIYLGLESQKDKASKESPLQCIVF